MNTAPLAFRYLAESIVRDAVLQGAFFGDRKIFLASIPGINLGDAECTGMLLDLLRAGLLRFARADLVSAMDPALVAASEWKLDGATYHFLVVEPVAAAQLAA